VFITRGTLIKPRNFNRRIAKAGAPKVTVHGARKTFGSLLAALDVHPRVATQILRHSKIALTIEVYTEAPSAVTPGSQAVIPGLGTPPRGRTAIETPPPGATTTAVHSPWPRPRTGYPSAASRVRGPRSHTARSSP
jgi:hypothetical protein